MKFYKEEVQNGICFHQKTKGPMGFLYPKFVNSGFGIKQGVLIVFLCFISMLPAQSQTMNVSPYCNARGSCNFGGTFDVGTIDSVRFGNLTNYGTGCSSGISNNTGSEFTDNNIYYNNLAPIEAEPGGSISCFVRSVEDPNDLVDVAVWIDFNQNQKFEDDEIGYISQTKTNRHNFTIDIPRDAKCGVTRLRVMTVLFQRPNDPCLMAAGLSGPEWGEVEDYDIKIQPKGSQDDISLTLKEPSRSRNKYGIEPLTVEVINSKNGSIPSGTNFSVKYRIDTAKAPQSVNYTLGQDLNRCDRIDVPLDTLNLACQQEYQIQAWLDFASDVDPTNDSIRFDLDTRQEFTLFQEGFESGNSGKFTLKNNGGRALVTDDNSLAGDAATGNYHLLLDDGGRPYFQTTIDLSKNPGEYFVEFDWQHAYDETCQPGDGIFVSTNGGNSFTRIVRLCRFGSYDTYYNFIYSINEQMRKKGLNPKGKVIIRFASDNSRDYGGTGTQGEGVTYDNFRFFRRKVTKFAKPSNLSIISPDTFFQGSPTRFQAGFSQASKFSINWIYDGQKLAKNQQSVLDTFSVNNPPKTADLKMVVAGCFGVDTVSKSIPVAQPTQKPNAEFTVDRNILEEGETVDFTNLSTKGGKSFTWNILPFELKNGDSTYFWRGNDTFGKRDTFEPRAQMVESGVYDVYLIARNGQGTDTMFKDNFIRVREFFDICSDSRYTDTVGTLTDGSDPGYPANANCSFVIDPCTKGIDLSINELDLRKDSAFLRIYDGRSSNGTPLWDVNAYGSKGITGDEANPDFQKRLTATSGAVYVEFESGSSPEGSGFEMGWNGNSRSLPELSASIMGDTAVCEGVNASFKAMTKAQDPAFEWYINEKQIGSAAPDQIGMNFMPKIKDGKNDTLRLVTKSCGRRDVQTAILSPRITNTIPQVDFIADKRVVSVNDTVRLTEMTKACVQDRTWQISPANYQFVNGTSDSSISPVVVFNEPGAYFVKLSNTTNGNASGSTSKPGYIKVIDYCTPSVVSLNPDIGISRFALENIDNSSGIGNQAYTNFIDETPNATLEKGAPFPVTIERNTTVNPANFKVWIDFNNDGDFNDNNEMVFMMDEVEGNKVMDTINIPNNVRIGTYRMRVAANLQNIPNRACGPNQTGEYEDYQVRIVPDQKAPDILLSGDDTVTLEACTSASGFIRSAFAEDLVDGRINNLTVNGNVDPQTPGFYTISYTVTDQNGNTATRDQVFEVLPDQVAPTFDLAGPDPFVLGVNKTFQDPGVRDVTDNCTGSPNVSVDDSDLNANQPGNYQVDYTVTDGSSNASTKTRMVKVVDTLAPEAELAGNDPLKHPVDQPFNDPGLQNITDNFWAVSDITVTTKGQVDFGTFGTNELIYMVEDGSGNMTRLSRTVIVEDLEGPSVTATFSDNVSRDDTLEVPVNEKANVRQTLTITDNSGAFDITDVTGDFFQRFPNGVPDVLGNYSVGYNIVDTNGNETKVRFMVKVVDKTAPTIRLKGEEIVKIPRFDTTPYEAVDSVMVSDNYYTSFQLDVETSGSYFETYKDTFPNGSFDIDYTVTDPSGNSATITRSVIISEPTGIQQVARIQGLEAYPNPVDDNLQINIKGKQVKGGRLTMTNVLGQRIKEIANGRLKGSYQVNVKQLDSGVYFLRLSTEDSVKQQKIIVQ